MPEILNLEASDWTLTVWTKETEIAQSRLEQTIRVRGGTLPAPVLRFNPPLAVVQDDCIYTKYHPPECPHFFENKHYEFEFVFLKGRFDPDYAPVIKHRLKNIEEAFRFLKRSNSLRGSINFGNDIGWFCLRLVYYSNTGKLKEQSVSFEVWPLKMDMHRDLDTIQQTIDDHYPLWRFALSNKTELELERSRKPHERFPLLWLAQFKSLREELEAGVKEIINAPHSRLQSHTQHKRAERLKKRLSPALEEQITNDLIQGLTHRRYRVEQRQLSIDTSENRFIKQVLKSCLRQLGEWQKCAREHDKEPEQSRFSQSFYDEIKRWQQPLQKQLNHAFFRELGSFKSLSGESLVLHQKPGYSRVYRVWQQLRMYLEVMGNHAAVSVKSVAELYEVWCFLEVRRILVEALGFTEQRVSKVYLKAGVNGLNFKDGRQAAFEFQRGEMVIRLSHEPVFSRIRDKLKPGIYSWTTVQKPDILLEAQLVDNRRLLWVFDAKYRISNGRDQTEDDMAPDEAINQMHRYRDALIYSDSSDIYRHTKSRPVYGAFVLYPGWFDETVEDNPYRYSVDAVGIGAFPLLPCKDNRWLTEFLRQQFDVLPAETSKLQRYRKTLPDRHFVQEAGRIGYSGMQKPAYYKDLTMVAGLGKGRDTEYMKAYREGKAKWYHLPVSTSEDRLLRMAHHVMEEIRYCALTVHVEKTYQRQIRYIYPVLNIQRLQRRMISREQSGSKMAGEPEKEYWLFELGEALPEKVKINVGGLRGKFTFMLTTRNDLKVATDWKSIHHRYSFLFRSEPDSGRKAC